MQDFGTKADNSPPPGGQLSAAEFNNLATENENAVLRSGQGLSGASDTQLAESLFLHGVKSGTFQDSGAANAYVATPVSGASGVLLPDAYTNINGAIISFKAANTNSGASTLNIGQTTGTLIGTKPIRTQLDAPIPANTILAGQQVELVYNAAFDSGSGAWEIVPWVSSEVPLAFANLRSSATGLSAIATITADSIVVLSSVGSPKRLMAVSVTPSLAASGANGLDTGISAASTWYAAYVIWNPATQVTAGLFSLSGTAPTMPAGFTHRARTGWVRSDATVNKFPFSYQQFGPNFGYKIAGNLTNMPTLATGTAGSIAGSPAGWVATSVSNAVPTTASVIRLFISITSGASGTAISAPNPLFGGVGGNPSTPHAVSGAAASPMAVPAEFVIEGTNVYYASNAAAAVMNCMGWIDNL